MEIYRIKELINNGLTIALALGLVMITCNIANERNKRVDVSYFRTSSPGEATVNMVGSLNETMKVMLFFPDVNEVLLEVEGYFEALQQETNDKIVIEKHDWMASPTLAKEHGVKKDGTVVFVRGDKTEKLQISPEIDKARKKDLREFDSKVQEALMKVIREKRTIYFTTGHGELNDPSPDRQLIANIPDLARGSRKSSVLKKGLKMLNYDTKDLGFGKPIPDDADIVVVLAPTAPLLDVELQQLDQYLAGGGAVLFALDPIGEATLGVLESRLGVRFNPAPLADQKEHLRYRGAPTEREWIMTNQFSSHASITTTGRQEARSGIVLFKAGSLEDAEFGTKSEKRKRTYTVRSPRQHVAGHQREPQV